MINKNKYRGIIALEVVNVKTSDVVKLKSINKTERVIHTFMPEYIISDNDKLNYTADYLCFVDESFPESEYTCFDVKFADDLTNEELSAIGVDDFLEKAIPFIKKMKKISFNDYRRTMGNHQYLVIEYDYFNDDCEWEFKTLEL